MTQDLNNNCLAEAGGCTNLWDADLNDDTVKICPGKWNLVTKWTQLDK